MSQKKVDAYKAQKANRKQIMKKEKTMLMVEKTVGLLLGVAIVGWIGYSGYGVITGSGDDTAAAVTEYTPVDTTALNDFMGTVSEWSTETTEAETEGVEEEAEAAEEETEGAEETEAAEEEAEAAAEETEAAEEETKEAE